MAFLLLVPSLALVPVVVIFSQSFFLFIYLPIYTSARSLKALAQLRLIESL